MGVFIKAVKPLDLLIETEKNNINFERLNNAEETIDNDTIIVFSLDFTPLEHLTKFKYGLYVEGEHGENDCSMAYSTYNAFRASICKMVTNEEYNDYCRKIMMNEIDSSEPFVEFFWFADNEGCFDYAVAEKLYKDFEKYYNIASEMLDSRFFNYYKSYMAVLKDCIELKGVVEYR